MKIEIFYHPKLDNTLSIFHDDFMFIVSEDQIVMDSQFPYSIEDGVKAQCLAIADNVKSLYRRLEK